MAKTLAGILLGLLIGAGCRWFDVPVPSPPKLLGALLVVAMTVGYMATDRFLTSKFAVGGTAGRVQSDGRTGASGSQSRP
jgi:XapX domain-containing protein